MIATQTKPYKKDGIWNYPELPAGMRKAVPADFDILTSELVFGINILNKPDVLSDYQARCIRDRTALKEWSEDIAAGKVFVDKLPYKENGLWYYPGYPLGCRKAILNDFFTVDLEIKPGIDFLVLGTGVQEYEAHRTSELERFAAWLDWIPAGRIFVKSN
jgi:hypothetical protein